MRGDAAIIELWTRRPLISRSEVEGMILAIYDIRDDMKRLVGWIEEDDDGEEEEESD